MSVYWTHLQDPFQRGYYHGREISIAFLRDKLRQGIPVERALIEFEALTQQSLEAMYKRESGS